MKKEDLITLGIAEDVAEKVFVLHGKGLEPFKTQLATVEAERDGLKTQLTEAGVTIEGFKKLDVDGIKAAADDYKAKFEQATSESAAQLASLKFDHWLDGALTTAKAKNLKSVRALLDIDALKKAYDEKSNTVVGFDEHLKPIKSENEFLFTDTKEPPKIVVGGNSKTVLSDPMTDAIRKGAGLATEEK